MTWTQLIGLYPHLVEVGGSSSNGSAPPQLWRSLREVLLQYTDLLHPPPSSNQLNCHVDNELIDNGNNALVNGT